MRFASTMLLSAFVTGLSALHALADGPLPFPDGRYVTDQSICGLDSAEMVDRYADTTGRFVRIIQGRTLEDGYELSCDISKVRRSGSDVTFLATCAAEGETKRINGHYVAIDEDAFAVSGSVFRRCASTPQETHADGLDADTDEIIELYADANDRCRGGSGDDPRTLGACGEREEYFTILTKRGWCYGREGEAGFQMEWHVCGPNSVRD
ncbi:hypothetical protein GTW51_11005 [Aurantimonas aggregata]|uniref:DUF3617 family protein n=1 Tax=Aurantimonas aggregata TaxID=2047720 RepID=A0A6L9MHC4_9HYPH|nr:hypothetical protein [Aurantimonas aggregata]NDV87229.1 hypothetical protein [Aurantimonas aggregata]